jgi:hypothetical protein
VPVGEAFAPIFMSAWAGSCVGIWLVWLLSDGRVESQRLLTQIVAGIAILLSFHFLGIHAEQITIAAAALHGTGNVGLLMAATALGLLVGRGLQKPNYLIMAAIVGAVTDIFSVYSGPSKHVLSSSVFPYVSFHWGLIGQGEVLPIVGAGDFIFLALYFFGARKFGLDDRKTFAAMAIAFAVGFLSAIVTQRGIPALPFMSLALLLAHGRELKRKSAQL